MSSVLLKGMIMGNFTSSAAEAIMYVQGNRPYPVNLQAYST